MVLPGTNLIKIHLFNILSFYHCMIIEKSCILIRLTQYLHY